MIDIKDPKDCCGCTACASICSHNAITMQPDALGFMYPKVDKDICVNCGLCDKVCQFNDYYDQSFNLTEPVAYAARHKNIDEIMKSRSGAAFVALSDYVLEHGGVVYGAGYIEHFRVAHKRAETKGERDDFRGSKYVQSDLGGIFRQVKEDLQKGRIVLFSGTPCQTSGLNAFVGRKLRENLFLVDIVCHGTPSPYIWRDYLAFIEKVYCSKVIAANFREKNLFGWADHRESFKFSHDFMIDKTVYTALFYKHITFRHSCGVCHFTNLHRPSDVTLADYWGWQRTDPTFNADDKGCSLVLCNTEKGMVLFEKVQNNMNVIHASLSNVLQRHLQKPSDIHPLRMQFEAYYVKYGFERTMREFGIIGWRFYLKMFAQRLLNHLSHLKNTICR